MNSKCLGVQPRQPPWSLLLRITLLDGSLSHWTRAGLWPIKQGRRDGTPLSRLSNKRLWLCFELSVISLCHRLPLPLPLSASHSGGSQVQCHEQLPGEQLRPPLPTATQVSLEADSTALIKPQPVAQLRPREIPWARTSQLHRCRISDPQKLCKTIRLYVALSY